MKKTYIYALLFSFLISSTPIYAIEKTGPSTFENSGSQYCGSITPGLKIGDTDYTSNGQVTELQNILYFKGHLKIKPNGKFDLNTKNAIYSMSKALGNVKDYSNGGMMNEFIASAVACPDNILDSWHSSVGYVYSPATGSTLKRNETLNISWNISPALFAGGTLKLISTINPNKVYVITDKVTPFTGRFSWKIGKTNKGIVIPDGVYDLELCEIGSKAYCTIKKGLNLSSTNFNTLTVISPTKNDILVKSKPYTIKWKPTPLDKIDISLVTGSGKNQTEFQIAKNVSAKAGQYEWVVPENFATGYEYKYKIKIGKGLVTGTSEEFTVRYQSDMSVSIDRISSFDMSLNDTITVYGKGFGTSGNMILLPIDSTTDYYSTGYGAKDENGNPIYKFGQGDDTSITFMPNYFDMPSHKLKPGKYFLSISAFDANNETVVSNRIIVHIK